MSMTDPNALYIIGGDDKCVARYLRELVTEKLGAEMAPGIPASVLDRTSNISFSLPALPQYTPTYAVADSLTGTAFANFLRALDGVALDGMVLVTLADEAGSAEAEKACAEWCATRNLPLLTLRCPMVIGNGMEGRAKGLADAVATGGYWHIKDVDSECSAVTAVDVARVIAALAGQSGSYTVTDGERHSMAALINGMAHRLNDKRVLTLAPAAAKWLDRFAWMLPWWKRLKARRATPRILSGEPVQTVLPDFTPRNVIDYLADTH